MENPPTFLDAVFSPIPASSRLSGFLLVLVGGLAWLMAALLAHPPSILDGFVIHLGQFVSSVFSFPFQAGGLDRAMEDGLRLGVSGYVLAGQVLRAMFSADVLRHVLALLAPFYLVYRAAVTVLTSIHLDDVSDPTDLRTASLYMRSAAFGSALMQPGFPGRAPRGSRIGRLIIENGGYATNPVLPGVGQDPGVGLDPIHRIGGPGQVQVNLENAAVFDRADGEVHIVGPTMAPRSQAVLLENFERLRDVIDLRDQLTSISASTAASGTDAAAVGGSHALPHAIEGRTRDGIRIQVRDVRVVFSVLRSNAPDAGHPGSPPYSYREEALRRLVYARGNGPWTTVMLDLVKDQLQSFIASHSLSQILAATGLPEVEAQQVATTQIIRTAAAFFPGPKAASTPGKTLPGTANHPEGGAAIPMLPDETAGKETGLVPRLELTDLFYNPVQGFSGKASQQGVQLHWIDVGTWSVPASAITERQVEAWRMSIENETRRRDLKTIESESRLDELLRLVRDVPLIRFAEAQQAGKPAEQVIAGLISDYLGLLRAAVDVYQREGKPVPPRLVSAVEVTGQALQTYLEDSGQAKYI
jgi:hypothetical protein